MAKKATDTTTDYRQFKLGDVVVFEPKNFNPDFWNELSEKDRRKYYGPLGYGQKKKFLFVFICEINDAPEHCVLVSLDNQKVETMRHTRNFRKATEDEV
jgi:hypothetical protein